MTIDPGTIIAFVDACEEALESDPSMGDVIEQEADRILEKLDDQILMCDSPMVIVNRLSAIKHNARMKALFEPKTLESTRIAKNRMARIASQTLGF